MRTKKKKKKDKMQNKNKEVAGKKIVWDQIG